MDLGPGARIWTNFIYGHEDMVFNHGKIQKNTLEKQSCDFQDGSKSLKHQATFCQVFFVVVFVLGPHDGSMGKMTYLPIHECLIFMGFM